ncbi:Similar to DNAH9: Dynein heavy chain 9, partial [Cotesia congregata]
MFSMELSEFHDIAQTIVTNAIKESTVEEKVNELVDFLQSINFKVIKKLEGLDSNFYILGSVEYLIQNLEDNTIALQNLKSSPYIKPFLDIVQKWEITFREISEVIEAWTEFQTKWLYLREIFFDNDIKLQLPEKTIKFEGISRTFKQIMFDTAERPNVYKCCMIPDRKKKFENLLFEIDECLKSLHEYLSCKRMIFPRFSFLCDDELLRILAENDTILIQKYITKMFDNIEMFKFQEDEVNNETKMICTAVISCECEIMELKNPVIINTKVEIWMATLLEEIKNSNRHLIKKAIYIYGKMKKPRIEWLFQFQGVVIFVVNQIWRTVEIEEVFEKIKLNNKRAMKENNVIKIEDFKWQSQLRFYWIYNLDNCWINQCTGRFEYGYEYMGLNERLVVTPLTDRIYLTITQALSVHLGTSLAGYAGTGKTETVKNLAKTLGLLCIVTNCSEGIDHVTIGEIFRGLIQCGAWGCFDEFDHIDVSVLSIISLQLQTLRSALQRKATKFLFQTQDIALDPKCGLFITMQLSYDNQTQLPESVKGFFRPIAVVVPDSELICQVKLFSAGFLTAKSLAKKITVLYHLAKNQLSKQNHYDFGLRALVSILNRARYYKKVSENLVESTILLRALKDVNLSKFISDDVPIFIGLLKNLFLELDSSITEYPLFNEAVENIYRPYDVTRFYGVLNPLNREWTDGIFSNIFRKFNQSLNFSLLNEKRFIIFDGDVDSIWIENMNSVMDDNKILTLPNQERIKLRNNCSLIFEVGHLKYASPATVSRVGIVYVDPNILGYEPFIKKWIKNRRESEQELLLVLYQKYIPRVLALIIDGILGLEQVDPLQMIIHQNALNLVSQLCKMVDSLYPSCHQYNETSTNDKEFHVHQAEEEEEEKEALLHAVFIQACYCSMGAALVSEAQFKFDDYMKEISGLMIIKDTAEKLASIGYIPTAYKLLYEYVLDVKNKVWRPWKMCVPQYIHNRNQDFHEIFVPTSDTLRTFWFIRLMKSLKQPVLLVGETETAKTAMIENFSRSLDPAKTKSTDVQRSIESYVEKRTRDLYSPRLGRTLAIFIDDMSLPIVDLYETQQPIAFLKLFLDYGGFLAAMTGERRNNAVDPRFISLLAVYYTVHPDNTSLNYIYSSILAGHLAIFSDGIQAITNILVKITIELCEIVQFELPPIPCKFHYNFNMKDFSKICAGLLQSIPSYFFTAAQFVRLWKNEITRVICDRLISEEDRNLVQNRLEMKIKSEWEKNPDIIENALRDPLLFGNFRNALNDDGIQNYEDVLDYEAVYNLFIEILELYNKNNVKLEMILFNDALEHLIRVHRILKMHRGHVLLVGASGSGKQSVIRLASFAAKCDVFEILLDFTYNETSFQKDIKKLLNLVGIDNNKILFLFTSAQIVDENFLEIINNILAAEIPFTLYTENEIDKINDKCKGNVTQEGYCIDKENIWSYFTKTCTANLHIALSMSPVDDLFKKHCRNYPGIVKNTTINWMFQWPQQALFAVSNFLMKD